MAIIGISGKIGSGKDTIGKIIQYLQYCKFFKIEPLTDSILLTQLIPYIPNQWIIKKFAGKLKQIVSILTGISVEDLERPEIKNAHLGPEWDTFEITDFEKPRKDIVFIDEKAAEKFCTEFSNSQHHYTYNQVITTPRKLLQTIGTELGRRYIHPNVWINSLFEDYKKQAGSWNEERNTTSEEYPNWLITDLRFPNEAKAIKDKEGILIRVNRPFKASKNDTDLTIATGHLLMAEAFKNKTGPYHPSETALDEYKDWNHIIDNSGTIEELIEKVKQVLILEKLF